MHIKQRILLYGRGTLAIAIEAAAQKQKETTSILRFSKDDNFAEARARVCPVHKNLTDGIGIYAAKTADHLNDFIDLCAELHIPMIQGSTGQKLPDKIRMPIIVVPNFAIPIMLFLAGLETFVSPMVAAGLRRHVTELHQETKTTVPGTARAMAKAVGVLEDKIVSIRDPNVARRLNVPNEHLGRHGCHIVGIHGCGASIELNTVVHGAEAYGEGAMFLIPKVLACMPLENKVYNPEDFLA